MSEMTARERIHQEVYEAYQAGIDHECVPHKYPPMKQEDIAEIADSILTIVREALLSEQAKEAASYFASYDDIPVIVDSLLNAGLGTRFITEGYDEPLGTSSEVLGESNFCGLKELG